MKYPAIISMLMLSIYALSISGCATVQDPVVWQSNNISQSKIAPKKILVLFDFSIEYPYIPSGLAVSKEENINKSYGQIAKTIVKNIKDQGIEAEYELHYSPIPLSVPTTGYSHILIQSLTKMTRVTSSSGNYVKDRVWRGTLIELPDTPSTRPTILSSQLYTSDGPSCFAFLVPANNSECRIKYLELLMKHLSLIGITNIQTSQKGT